ncbi:hypothetical protein C8Q74DRAFT_1394985 [Fomes fomentarius]|nr:hypothetical protein C8Q74DRAFT_1394985 [Fomes fomentarius]
MDPPEDYDLNGGGGFYPDEGNGGWPPHQAPPGNHAEDGHTKHQEDNTAQAPPLPPPPPHSQPQPRPYHGPPCDFQYPPQGPPHSPFPYNSRYTYQMPPISNNNDQYSPGRWAATSQSHNSSFPSPHHPAPRPASNSDAPPVKDPVPATRKKHCAVLDGDADNPVTTATPKKAKAGAKSGACSAAGATAAKGKGKATSASVGTDACYTSRQPGAQNYTDDDLSQLLDLVDDTSMHGLWQMATLFAHTSHSKHNMNRYTLQLACTTKPTGSADVPENVTRAWEIEERINRKIHLCALNDEDIADTKEEMEERVIEVEDDSDPEIEVIEPPLKRSKTPSGHVVAKGVRLDTLALRHSAGPTRGGQAKEFLATMLVALDLATREACDDARFAWSLMQDEMACLTQENHDLHARVDVLQDQLHSKSQHAQQQALQVSTLQSRLELTPMMHSLMGSHTASSAPPSAFPWDFSTPTQLLSRFHDYQAAVSANMSALSLTTPPLSVRPCSRFDSTYGSPPGQSMSRPFCDDQAHTSSSCQPEFVQGSSSRSLDTLAAVASRSGLGRHCNSIEEPQATPRTEDGTVAITLTFTPTKCQRCDTGSKDFE